ncbi:MAG: prepilin-type N-terminal cleavage/methylation domain-containing protein [Candidatus Omnitrophica bacterium]|nr:prepilin-type N-terminal cleavage/methylation domain-containing protein [Candidatus Omnitrophota bacterium]
MNSLNCDRLRLSRGFTLIELLIVIAIILILIAIALPNFLEAQVRAKVTRVWADLRTISIAMESYRLDFGNYPTDSEDDLRGLRTGLLQLTTPLQYIAVVPFDVFSGDVTQSINGSAPHFEMGSTGLPPSFYAQGRKEPGNIHAFALYSHGPDTYDWFEHEENWPFNGPANPCPTPTSLSMGTTSYSPTNGTKSIGNMHEFGGSWRAGNWCLDGILIRGDGWDLFPIQS